MLRVWSGGDRQKWRWPCRRRGGTAAMLIVGAVLITVTSAQADDAVELPEASVSAPEETTKGTAVDPPLQSAAPAPVAAPASAPSKRRRATAQKPEADTRASSASRKKGAAQQPTPSAQVPTTAPGADDTTDDQPHAANVFAATSGLNTVMSATDAVATSAQTLADALAQQPGIASTQFTAGASRPVIRGQDAFRVRVEENGIGSHDVSALSEDHGVPVDLAAATRVDVIRGPATLRYGGAAIGGVVAVESARIPTRMPASGWTGMIRGGLSSVENGRDGALSVTAGSNAGVVVHADAFRRMSDDYNSPLGRIDNSFVDSHGGAFGVSRIGTDGFAGMALSALQSDYGIAGEETRIDLEQIKLTGRGEWRVRDYGLSSLRWWFGASNYAHDEVGHHGHDGHDHDDDDHGPNEIGARFKNQEQELRIEAETQPNATQFGALTTVYGLSSGHRHTRGQSFEGDSLLEPARTFTIGAFVLNTLALSERTALEAGARLDVTRIGGRGRRIDVTQAPVAAIGSVSDIASSETFAALSASAGARHALSRDLIGRLTASLNTRAPDAAELFSNGVHEATGTFEIGNADLDTERAVTLEASLSNVAGPFRFDATAFATHYDGFIYKELQGIGCGETLATCGIDDELDLILFRQRAASFYGAELSAIVDVLPIAGGMVRVDGRYDFVRATFSNGENVPRLPPHRVGLGLSFEDNAWRARVGALHAFAQNSIGAHETPTDGYTLVDAELRYTWRSGSAADGTATETTFGIRGDNLLDEVVRNHVSFRKDEIVAPGASVRVFGSVTFN